MTKHIRPKFTGTGKTCTKCFKLKPFADFYKDKYNHAGLTTRCKVCMTATSEATRNTPEGRLKSRQRWKAWRDNNPVKFRNQFLRKYGIDCAEFNRMLEAQGGKCAICRTDNPGQTGIHGKHFHVDHCHDEGHIRGLLCRSCNAGIGQFLHRIDFLQAAIEYLSRTKN